MNTYTLLVSLLFVKFIYTLKILPVNGVKATHQPHINMVQESIQFLGPSGESKFSGTYLPLSSCPYEAPNCSNASVCQDSCTRFER